MTFRRAICHKKNHSGGQLRHQLCPSGYSSRSLSPILLFRGLDIVLNYNTIYVSHPSRRITEENKVYIESASVVFDHTAIWLDGAAVRIIPNLLQPFIWQTHQIYIHCEDGEVDHNGTKVSIHGAQLWGRYARAQIFFILYSVYQWFIIHSHSVLLAHSHWNFL